MEAIIKIFSQENIIWLLKGAAMSLFIACICLVAGTILGVLAASAKISRNKILKVIGSVYVEVIRGTPMLLQISFFFLGVPSIYRMITGGFLRVSNLWMGILAISINSGAYSCELIRGAINSIDKGQWEAGRSLGLTHKQNMRKIILPQAFKRIIPPLANEFITLVKDSSLVSTIGVVELMQAQRVVGTAHYNFFFPLIGAGVIYLVITFTISRFTGALERKMAESD